MVDVHTTYNKERFEKLCGMFSDKPRQGNPTLYVREHFDLKRVCQHCETRGTTKNLAAASLIAEGDSWVVPFSVTRDDRIIIDLESFVPDQSLFFSERVLGDIEEIGIQCKADGLIEHVIPIHADRDEYFRSLRKNKIWDYNNARKHFTCRVITDASPDDVMKWDTEVQFDFDLHHKAKTGQHRCGFNVETEYYQWLAQNGQLAVARISDHEDSTLALAYLAPGEYELLLEIPKRRTAAHLKKYGLGNALIFMALDHIYEKGLLTPLSLGTTLHKYKEVWRPVPMVRPCFVFADLTAQQKFFERFGTD